MRRRQRTANKQKNKKATVRLKKVGVVVVVGQKLLLFTLLQQKKGLWKNANEPPPPVPSVMAKRKEGGLDLSLRFCSNIFSAQVSVSCALQLHLSLSRRLELTHHQHRSGPATESSLSLVYSPARLSTICMKRRKFMTLHREWVARARATATTAKL